MRLNKHSYSKVLVFALAASFAMSAAAPSGTQSPGELIKKGKLTVGVVSGTPPFGSIDAKGVPVGYDVDVANLIGKYINLPVELVPLTAPARVPSLESCKVDFRAATRVPASERAVFAHFPPGVQCAIEFPLSGAALVAETGRYIQMLAAA
ncbi:MULTISPECIES: transporter substrate-binding domain-containing protein [unclassified Janthinobacterium]|uniref:transporter substrate-binding domain-containing protein n=1 Tax=unclassified Janthinobacterium TaxID=2610881 RepID=UPI00036AAEE1|nr:MULTISPECIES: transporter substrate-binding domain-containing protein [unclassified Janthinobacterium]